MDWPDGRLPVCRLEVCGVRLGLACRERAGLAASGWCSRILCRQCSMRYQASLAAAFQLGMPSFRPCTGGTAIHKRTMH